jgi:hypothetical protein
MLCVVCKTRIETAYNDCCFDCYRKQKIEKTRTASAKHSVA